MKRFLVLNGPNINFTGIREVGVYGAETFESILGYIRKEAERLGCEVTFFQSNHEGALIDALQQAHMDKLDGVVFNPGGYTHTSVALHDAIASIAPPVVEVHFSNIQSREGYRHASYTAPACLGQIAGFGKQGYVLALEALLRRDA